MDFPGSLSVLSLVRVMEKNGSKQETPRAKKEVNGSLSPHVKEVNKTNGCILFLCLACPFKKKNTVEIHLLDILYKISNVFCTALNFKYTMKKTLNSL